MKDAFLFSIGAPGNTAAHVGLCTGGPGAAGGDGRPLGGGSGSGLLLQVLNICLARSR